MIICCPGCGKRFGVSDHLIPPAGRRARCAGCGKVFLATRGHAEASAGATHVDPIGMPGDGLATSSSFVAPAAPPDMIPPSGKSGDPAKGREWRPVLVRPVHPKAKGLADILADEGLDEGEEGAEDANGSTPEPSARRRPLVSREGASRREAGAVAPEREQPPAAGETSPQDATEACGTSGSWGYKSPTGADWVCGAEDIVRMIREGLLSREDEVLPSGAGEWVRAGEVGELAPHFAAAFTDAAPSAAGPHVQAAGEPKSGFSWGLRHLLGRFMGRGER